MKAWQRRNLKEALDDVILLEDEGHTVERLNDWHWRINGVNVWPTTKKYQKKLSSVVHTYQKLSNILHKNES